MDKQAMTHWMQRRWKLLCVTVAALIVLGYGVYLWLYLSTPPLVTPMFLLSTTERAEICGREDIVGEFYDIRQDGRNLVTPEHDLTLEHLIDQEGRPDGYVTFRAFTEQRCYFLRLYWFEKGFSADTVFLPSTDKTTIDVGIRRIEYFSPVDDIADYAQEMEMNSASLESAYHEWTDIESIDYP